MLEQKRGKYLREFIQGDEQRHIRKPSRMGGRKGKIYNSIFIYKDAPIEKKMPDLFERRIICEEKECINMSY